MELDRSEFADAQSTTRGGRCGWCASRCDIFHFGPGQRGGVQANVDRWFAQFGNSNTKQHEEKTGSTRIIHVQARGTFQSGMPGGPTTPLENYGLRGAILEDPEKGDVFVKMTGPAPLVESASSAFDEMVRAAAASRD